MQQVDPDLLERYFKGQCSAAETEQVADWLKTPQGFNSQHLLPSPEKNLQLKKELWERVNATKGNRPVLNRHFFKWGLIAATLLIVLSLLFQYQIPFYLSRKQPASITFHAPYGKKSTLQLPDGSIAELNAGATVSYPKHFKGNIREITLLQGEAFFRIKQDKKRPFIVQVSNAAVHVLGTHFNIANDSRAKQLAITLASGKIAFKSQEDERIMQPGDQLLYNIQDKRILSVSAVDLKKVTAWRDNILLFEETPLKEVFQTLGSYYGVQFVVRKKLDTDLLFTAQFRGESLRRVLELIELSTDLHCYQEQNQIIVN